MILHLQSEKPSVAGKTRKWGCGEKILRGMLERGTSDFASRSSQ